MLNKQLITDIQKSLSKEPKVKLAYVLGSAAAGRTGSESDFDLAIVVDDKANVQYERIYGLVHHINFPKNLDLSIVDKNSSPLFLFQIISTGSCVYQKYPEFRISFEAFVSRNYYDSAHLRKIYYSYLKGKFSHAN